MGRKIRNANPRMVAHHADVSDARFFKEYAPVISAARRPRVKIQAWPRHPKTAQPRFCSQQFRWLAAPHEGHSTESSSPAANPSLQKGQCFAGPVSVTTLSFELRNENITIILVFTSFRRNRRLAVATSVAAPAGREAGVLSAAVRYSEFKGENV